MCCICGRAIALETAKTNEYGCALHEECYVLRLQLEQATKPVGTKSTQAITEMVEELSGKLSPVRSLGPSSRDVKRA
jgi:hypothetical protein